MAKIFSKEIDNKRYDNSIWDYLSLMKPRVMSLVVFTALIGFFSENTNYHPFIAFVFTICISMGAGSAAAINMWYDRDIDAIMLRTQKRPIVTGRILAEEALSFGVIIGILSVIMMALCINIFAAILLSITILYYVFIYTIWLKRTTPQNVVIGGVSGALPPIIGAVAASNYISLQSIILFLIIFTWTPPHSWALSLFRSEDYKKCSIPMMNLVKGENETKKQILIYSIILFFTSLTPFFIGSTGYIYLITSLILGIGFLYHSIFLLINKNTIPRSKKLFFYSIFYLATLFLIFFADRI